MDRELSILIVDDEDVVRRALVIAAETGPWDVRQAASAEDALTLIEQRMPDVVISDKNMPGMSGLALLVEVRERSQETCFHLVTGYASHDSAELSLAFDIDGYVQKPVRNIFDLLASVRKSYFERQAKLLNLRKRGPLLGEPGQRQPLMATLYLPGNGRRESIADMVEVAFPKETVLFLPETLDEVPEDVNLIITTLSRAPETQARFPHAFLGVLAPAPKNVDLRVSLTQAGLSVIDEDAPKEKAIEQLRGFYQRARPDKCNT